jgi:hypothetical protein
MPAGTAGYLRCKASPDAEAAIEQAKEYRALKVRPLVRRSGPTRFSAILFRNGIKGRSR